MKKIIVAGDIPAGVRMRIVEAVSAFADTLERILGEEPPRAKRQGGYEWPVNLAAHPELDPSKAEFDADAYAAFRGAMNRRHAAEQENKTLIQKGYMVIE